MTFLHGKSSNRGEGKKNIIDDLIEKIGVFLPNKLIRRIRTIIFYKVNNLIFLNIILYLGIFCNQ